MLYQMLYLINGILKVIERNGYIWHHWSLQMIQPGIWSSTVSDYREPLPSLVPENRLTERRLWCGQLSPGTGRLSGVQLPPSRHREQRRKRPQRAGYFYA